MISYTISTLRAAAMPSLLLVPSSAPSVVAAWQLADGQWAARKRTAPVGAPAYAHVVCAAQHTNEVSEEQSVSVAVVAESLGNGLTFGTQLSADAMRVDGRAGSPPRGIPPV